MEPWAESLPSGQFYPRDEALPRILFHMNSKHHCEAGSITFDLQMTKENKASEVAPLVSDPGFPPLCLTASQKKTREACAYHVTVGRGLQAGS